MEGKGTDDYNTGASLLEAGMVLDMVFLGSTVDLYRSHSMTGLYLPKFLQGVMDGYDQRETKEVLFGASRVKGRLQDVRRDGLKSVGLVQDVTYREGRYLADVVFKGCFIDIRSA